jgi:hypothetical protein
MSKSCLLSADASRLGRNKFNFYGYLRAQLVRDYITQSSQMWQGAEQPQDVGKRL